MRQYLKDMNYTTLCTIINSNKALEEILTELADDDRHAYMRDLFDEMPDCIQYDDVVDIITLSYIPSSDDDDLAAAKWLKVQMSGWVSDIRGLVESDLDTVIKTLLRGATANEKKLCRAVIRLWLNEYQQYANDWWESTDLNKYGVAEYLMRGTTKELDSFFVEDGKVYRETTVEIK